MNERSSTTCPKCGTETTPHVDDDYLPPARVRLILCGRCGHTTIHDTDTDEVRELTVDEHAALLTNPDLTRAYDVLAQLRQRRDSND